MYVLSMDSIFLCIAVSLSPDLNLKQKTEHLKRFFRSRPDPQ